VKKLHASEKNYMQVVKKIVNIVKHQIDVLGGVGVGGSPPPPGGGLTRTRRF
jgi:hypothetical protein